MMRRVRVAAAVIGVSTVGVGLVGINAASRDDVQRCIPSPRRAAIDGVVASRAHRERIFVSAGGRLFLSANRGRSWIATNDPAPGALVGAFGKTNDLLLAAGQRGLYASTDDGHSWKAWSCSMIVTSISGDPSGDVLFVAASTDFRTGAGGGLYETRDRGRSWVRSTALPEGNLNVNAVLVDPARDQTVYVATEAGGVLKSVDGARSFRWLSIGPPSPGLRRGAQVTVLAMNALSPRTVWAGTRTSGVWIGQRAGEHWVPDGLTHRYVESLVIEPGSHAAYASDSGTVQLGVSPIQKRPRGRAETVRTIAGRKWAVLDSLPGAWTLEVATDTAYAWRGRSIFSSQDHGRTWQRASPFPR
jgi:hypothetical protein